MKALYQWFLAFNSTFLIIVVFLVKENYIIKYLDNFLSLKSNMLSEIISWAIFILTPIIFTQISFSVAKKLEVAEIDKDQVAEIELANNSFLPTYLGYFFVSLGVNNIPTLIFVFLVIYIFTRFSQSLYFNPIFLIFGYQFYFIKTKNNVKIFIITKKQLKIPGQDGFNSLRRINDYTFIDLYNFKN